MEKLRPGIRVEIVESALRAVLCCAFPFIRRKVLLRHLTETEVSQLTNCVYPKAPMHLCSSQTAAGAVQLHNFHFSCAGPAFI